MVLEWSRVGLSIEFVMEGELACRINSGIDVTAFGLADKKPSTVAVPLDFLMIVSIGTTTMSSEEIGEAGSTITSATPRGEIGAEWMGDEGAETLADEGPDALADEGPDTLADEGLLWDSSTFSEERKRPAEPDSSKVGLTLAQELVRR